MVMFPEFRRFLSVYLAGLFASGMGIFWAVAHLAFPGPAPYLDKPGAYIAVGLLAGGVLASLRAQERRIRELERRLEARDAPAEPL
jgi:hypothetical protein